MTRYRIGSQLKTTDKRKFQVGYFYDNSCRNSFIYLEINLQKNVAHACKILSSRLHSLGFLSSSSFSSALSPRIRLEKKRRLVSVKSSFYVPFSLRPYSRYPGYTTGRFGRFRSPRQPPQAMTTRSKNLGRVAGPRPLRSVPPGRESAPKTESPGSLVPNSSVYVPEKNRSLRKWRTADHCL